MPRFSGFAYPDGLVVLDSETGEVRVVPLDGGAPRVLQPAVCAAPAAPAPAGGSAVTAAGVAAAREPLDDEVLATFPYPVARLYAAFVTERDPRQKCRLLVDTFTNVLKLWALQAASEYLRAPVARDAQLDALLARDLQRPLISTWNVLLARALPALRGAGVRPFAGELAAAYDALELNDRSPFAARVPYEDADGTPRERVSRLSHVQALIRYRNSLAHGYNQPADRAARELEVYTPLLRDVLRAGRFMARYPLHTVERAAGHGARAARRVRALRWMGAQPAAEATEVEIADEPSDALRGAPALLLDESSGDVLPLHAFFEVLRRRGSSDDHVNATASPDDLGVFDGSTRSTVIYVTADGAHVEKQHRLRDWQALLRQKTSGAVQSERDPSRLTVECLRAAAGAASGAVLNALAASGAYLREACAPRPELDERLAEFDLGDYRGFVLGGESGIGKTTLLARYTEDRLAAGDVVVLVRAATLLPGDELAARVRRELGLPTQTYFEDFLAAADPQFRTAGVRFRLIVDAVNEHPGDPAALVRAADALVRQARAYPWCRVLVSTRTSAYERLPPDARFVATDEARYLVVEEQRGAAVVHTPVVTLKPLAREHVGDAYERYRAVRRRDEADPSGLGVFVFRPRTAFAELDPAGSTVAMMRSPLLMRLIMAAFHRRELPSELSYDQAFDLFLEHVVLERDHAGGAFPERLAFLRTLVAQLDVARAEAIDRDRLYAVEPLRAALRNPQRDSPYVQLIELGVLVEQWDGDRCHVRVALDRLFDYLLARHHDAHVEGAADVVALVTRAVTFRALRGATEIILLRACRAGRPELLTGALETVAAGEPPPPEQALLAQIARDVVVGLARAQDAALDALLASFSARPSVPGVTALVEAFDQLLAVGLTVQAGRAVDGARTQAGTLGRDGPRAHAAFRAGLLCQQRGETAAARAAFDEAHALATRAGDALLAHRIDVWRARGCVIRGDLPDALALYESAFAGLLALGELGDAAEARRGQGLVVAQRGDETTRRAMTLEALQLARRAANPHVEARCLVSLGLAAMRAHELGEADECLSRALAIAETAGHLRNVAQVSGNLGVVRRRVGDMAGAGALYERALTIHRRLGDQRGAALMLGNLGILALERGDLDRADASFREAADALERAGDRSALAMTLLKRGVLARTRGDIAEAGALLARALEHACAAGHAEFEINARWLLASLALDAGELTAAREHTARMRQLAAASGGANPLHAAFVEAVELRLAIRDGAGRAAEVGELLARLDAAVERAGGHLAVDDLPIDAWLDVTRRALDEGAYAAARATLARAARLIAGRRTHRARELRELAAQAGEAPAP